MVVVVTNRKLCPGDFLSHIHELARAKISVLTMKFRWLSIPGWKQPGGREFPTFTYLCTYSVNIQEN